MSMSDERLKILEMLKEGKITADEALNLLEQVPDGNGRGGRQNSDRHFWDDFRSETQNPYPFYNFDWDWIDDLKETVQNAAYTGGFFFGGKEDIYKAEAEIGNGVRELVFDGKNSPVKIEDCAGDKIEIEANYKAKTNCDPRLALSNESGNLRLNYDSNALRYIGIKIRVPKDTNVGYVSLKTTNAPVTADDINADNIELFTKNAPIKASDIKGKYINCETRNAHIDLDDVEVSEIKAQTTNAKIHLDDVKSERVRLVTENAKISAEDSYAAHFSAKTSNAPIVIDDLQPNEAEPLCAIDCVTTNAGITLNLRRWVMPCKLRASTTNGAVHNELRDLEYTADRKNYIEGQTSGYEQAQNKLNLSLQTTNGGIHIS